ncbi:MAG: cytochrome c biogenesis protein CcdA [Patescibacteria group bacterium]|nr:cytochrome c biogenesis protein CcdA [Patescibacteria group bacterium]
MNKKIVLFLVLLIVIFASVIYVKSSGLGSELLQNANGNKSLFLPLIVFASLVDSVNPCAFSVLLLTIAFLFSLGRTRLSILKIGSAYIFGVFLVYILIGLGILEVLNVFGAPHFMSLFGAAIIILFGLISVINEFFPDFPIKLKIPQATHDKMARLMEKASLPTAFVLGAFVGLCEFPCTGGPYLMVLGLLHDQAEFLRGFSYLILYNFIFVLPLAIILLIASDRGLLNKVQEWRKGETKKMRLWGGLIMIALGLLIFAL